jgi:ABC-type transport system involved in cytochrome c biogenesis permease component
MGVKIAMTAPKGGTMTGIIFLLLVIALIAVGTGSKQKQGTRIIGREWRRLGL